MTSRVKYILGAIAGDIMGSVYEGSDLKRYDIDLFTEKADFTDDTVLTIATMDCLLKAEDYSTMYRNYARQFPGRGYGCGFINWLLKTKPMPYNSYGNGSAMRVSPIAWYCHTLEDVLREAKKSAECTHNHPEGIKGAQAIAASAFLARNGCSKDIIKSYVSQNFGYDLNRNITDIRLNYTFDSSCQHTVPEAIIAFIESRDFEDSIRLAISLGGDSDTIASMTGAIAEAYYSLIPKYIYDNIIDRLPLEMLNVIERFSNHE